MATNIAMKAHFVLLIVFISLNSVLAADNANYTAMLQTYVHDGKVQYPKLCKDPRLGNYLQVLAKTDPEKLPDSNQKLAFWINAYNAYTLKAICDGYPVKSINELHTGGAIVGRVLKTTIWDKDFVIINGKPTTLNHIEHEVIRPVFKDPRSHFALVCASKSCPALRTSAYEGSTLDQQLTEDARAFVADPKRNRFDLKNKKAYVSKIFDWYGKDFGKNKKEILLYLSQFLSEPLRESIRSDPDAWRIEYLDYDWSLNE